MLAARLRFLLAFRPHSLPSSPTITHKKFLKPSSVNNNRWMVSPLCTSSALLSKKGSKKSPPKEQIEEEMEMSEPSRETRLAAAKFINELAKSRASSKLTRGGGRDKNKSHHALHLRYEEASAILDVDQLWHELSSLLESQKQFYMKNLSLRSANVLDELPVSLENDNYPLRELAQISKRDPKQLIIDCSSFPQAASNVVKAIREAGLNLNPQQDGLRISVPLAKTSSEQRQQLAKGARQRMSETKQSMAKIQSRFASKLEDLLQKEDAHVSNDDVFALKALVVTITEHFVKMANDMMVVKQKELLGQ